MRFVVLTSLVYRTTSQSGTTSSPTKHPLSRNSIVRSSMAWVVMLVDLLRRLLLSMSYRGGGELHQLCHRQRTVCIDDLRHRYRFRLVSISCDPNWRFSIDNHIMTIIEVEGTNVQPLVVDQIQIYAGQRYSFVVSIYVWGFYATPTLKDFVIAKCQPAY